MKYSQDTSFKTARHIARSAQQTIKNKTGMGVSVMLCPTHITLKTPERMLYKIAIALGMSPETYTMKNRARDIVELRFIGAYFLRMYFPEVTLHQIAAIFGGQDHSSIVSGIARTNALLYTGDTRFVEKYHRAVNAVEEWLKNEVPAYALAASA